MQRRIINCRSQHFSVFALSTIIICKVELFTSNIMYLTFGRLAGVANSRQMLQSWLMVYVGNAIGIAAFALIFALAGGLGRGEYGSSGV